MSFGSWCKWWMGLAAAVLLLMAATGVTHLAVERPVMDIPLNRFFLTAFALFAAGWTVRGYLKNQDEQKAGLLFHWYQAWEMSGLGLASLCVLVMARSGHWPWEAGLGKGLIGAWLLGWVFWICLALVRMLLKSGGQIGAVAHTVLEEALRMRIVLVFLVALVLFLPILPFILDAEQPVRYRVQQFLGYGLSTSFVLMSLLTVFLSCLSLSSEIRDRQIYSIATKPISRGKYLLGKWVGIVSLNAVLILVLGGSIYLLTVFYLARQPVLDAYDRLALQEQVLVARQAITPVEPAEIDKMTDELLAREMNGSRESLARVYELGGPERYRQDLRNQLVAAWKSIGPMKGAGYRFEGLQNARQHSETLQLRYKVKVSERVPNDAIPVLMRINNETKPANLTLYQTQIMSINTDRVAPDGSLLIEIANRHPTDLNLTLNRTLQFAELEIMYQVDRFEPNLLRGLIVYWIKLGFLAMLGLATATVLSFPVACLVTMVIFLFGWGSPFMVDALSSFPAGREGLLGMIQTVIFYFSHFLTTVLIKFSEVNPRLLLVDGRLLSWSEVGSCLIWVGGVWTGMAALVGWGLFRRCELARVQV